MSFLSSWVPHYCVRRENLQFVTHVRSSTNSAFITPLLKKCITADANNYRPIALAYIMCKLMESIIEDQLLEFLIGKKLISKYVQHAFTKQHSTLTNTLQYMQDWLLDQLKFSSQHWCFLYIDFSRAFDSIVISKLLFKLECYGASGLLLKWISCLLNGRTQRVVAEGCFSSLVLFVSGKPQGSVLGPLLFFSVHKRHRIRMRYPTIAR